MADTLMGAHFQLRCPQCGYEYEFGFTPESSLYRMPADYIPPGPISIRQPTRCPSCGYQTMPGTEAMTMPVANGDRILVFKCIYQFTEPRRWDVIVFKNPIDPTENYIKRLIGLPGETIEIIDGDVYIDGLIARKPAQVQQELWMPVYDNDFQPVNPNQQGAFNGYGWRPPFNFDASAWRISDQNPTQIVLDSPANQINALTYGGRSANDFTVAYAYNDLYLRNRAPECSDLMVRFCVQPHSDEGRIGIALSKYGVEYRAWVDLAGEMILAKVGGDEETVLSRKPVRRLDTDASRLVKFANVDHQLRFALGGDELRVDLGRSPDAVENLSDDSPHAAILGAGKLTLSHVAIFRDIYYTDGSETRHESDVRATKGNAFPLNPDEFFVLGDNSPNSQDGRYWQRPTVATKGTTPPPAGVVPRYYLVGKALFVYWPSGFEFPWPAALKTSLQRSLNENRRNTPLRMLHAIVSLRWIPNFGRMRFIYGSRNGERAPAETAPTNEVARGL